MTRPQGKVTKMLEKFKNSSETSRAYFVRLVAVLTAICVAVALLLSAVNAMTEKKIEENTASAKEEAVLKIFTTGKRCEPYTGGGEENEIYLVFDEAGNILGCCAFVSTSGFGGDIEMMVGIASDYTTAGVSIVSMSETPGVGSKTNSDGFLDQFKGSPHDAPTEGFDAISGATISSKAVAAGIESAHGIDIDLEKIAGELGVSLASPVEDESGVPGSGTSPDEVETAGDDTAETEPNESAEPIETGSVITFEPAEPEPDPSHAEPVQPVEPEPEPVPEGAVEPRENQAYAENGGDPSYRYDLYAHSEEDEYKIEITPEEETAVIETETEGGTGA